MRLVKQSKLYAVDGIHNGNCLAACLASLLDIPLWMVPPFEDMFGRHTDHYMARVGEWLERMFCLKIVKMEGHDLGKLPEFYMACGESPRGVYHAVIYSKGELINDPHPSDAGIKNVEYTRHLESAK